MAISYATDIKKRLSVKTGAAGDSTASTPAGSLGKYMSTTDITDATDENLLRDTTGAEGESGIVIYRCMFFLNDHASLTWQSVKVWIASQIAGGANISIGLDPAGVVDRNAASAQAAEIANETTAPAGVTFSAPTSEATALSVGNVPADDCFAVWLRGTVPALTEALAADNVLIHVKGLSDS